MSTKSELIFKEGDKVRSLYGTTGTVWLVEFYADHWGRQREFVDVLTQKWGRLKFAAEELVKVKWL